MNVLIVGCGMVGLKIALSLCRAGHDISVIDKDPEKLKMLGDDFEGISVEGIPIDKKVLGNAGIESCDAVAAVTEDDSTNIIVCQIAKSMYNVPNVIARVFDSSKESIFKHFGINTICPTRLTTDTLYSAIVDKGEDKFINFGTATVGFSIIPMDLSEKRNKNRRLHEYPIKTGEEIYGVQHKDGDVSLVGKIGKNYILSEDDKIILTRVVD